MCKFCVTHTITTLYMIILSLSLSLFLSLSLSHTHTLDFELLGIKEGKPITYNIPDQCVAYDYSKFCVSLTHRHTHTRTLDFELLGIKEGKPITYNIPDQCVAYNLKHSRPICMQMAKEIKSKDLPLVWPYNTFSQSHGMK